MIVKKENIDNKLSIEEKYQYFIESINKISSKEESENVKKELIGEVHDDINQILNSELVFNKTSGENFDDFAFGDENSEHENLKDKEEIQEEEKKVENLKEEIISEKIDKEEEEKINEIDKKGDEEILEKKPEEENKTPEIIKDISSNFKNIMKSFDEEDDEQEAEYYIAQLEKNT